MALNGIDISNYQRGLDLAQVPAISLSARRPRERPSFTTPATRGFSRLSSSASSGASTTLRTAKTPSLRLSISSRVAVTTSATAFPFSITRCTDESAQTRQKPLPRLRLRPDRRSRHRLMSRAFAPKRIGRRSRRITRSGWRSTPTTTAPLPVFAVASRWRLRSLGVAQSTSTLRMAVSMASTRRLISRYRLHDARSVRASSPTRPARQPPDVPARRMSPSFA